MGDGEVPRWSSGQYSRDAFAAQRTKSEPLYLPGLAASWPARDRWTDAYLTEVAGDEKIPVMSRTDYSGTSSKRVQEKCRDVTLRELLDFIRSDDPPDLSYGRQTGLLRRVPRLAEDIHLPAALEGSAQPDDGLMWLGPQGTVAQMHWDSADNLFVQVRGQKQFILVSPDQSHLTYPNQFLAQEVAENEAFRQRFPEFASKLAELAERYHHQPTTSGFVSELSVIERVILFQLLASFNNCHVDAASTDKAKHPSFLEADRYLVTVGPGDAIFIPFTWRHCVVSLEASISVNWFLDVQTVMDGARMADAMSKAISEHITFRPTEWVDHIQPEDV